MEEIKFDYGKEKADIVKKALDYYFQNEEEDFEIEGHSISISTIKLDALNEVIELSVGDDFEAQFESGINAGLKLIDYGETVAPYERYITVRKVVFDEKHSRSRAILKYLNEPMSYIDDVVARDMHKFISNKEKMEELLRKEMYDNYVTGVSNASSYREKWEQFSDIPYKIETERVLSD